MSLPLSTIEYTDEDGVRWVLHKPKPTFVLLQPDIVNNKTRNNHFIKYGDVKPKGKKRSYKTLCCFFCLGP